MSKLIIYVDGGSRGNPGPAAGAYFIDGVKSDGKFLGEATNNEAEYWAVILALKKVKHLFGKEKIFKMEFEIRSDSELLVNQLSGNYKVEEENLQKLFMEIWNLKIDFGEIKFVHIPREKNKEADKMVNQILDRELSKLF